MNWLSARRSRRRKNQAGATFLAVGLLAGVLGIAPAFADPSDGVRCWADHGSDGSLTFAWSGVGADDVDDVWVSWWSDPDASQAAFSQRVPADLAGVSGQWTMAQDPYPAYPFLAIWWDDERDDQLCADGTMPGDLQDPTFSAKCASGFLDVAIENQGTTVSADVTVETETAPGTWETISQEQLVVPGFSGGSYGTALGEFPTRIRIVGDDNGDGTPEIDESFTWLYNPCSPDWAAPTIDVTCVADSIDFSATNNGATGDLRLDWTEADGADPDSRTWTAVANGESVQHQWQLSQIDLPLTLTVTAGDSEQIVVSSDAANCAPAFEITGPAVSCAVTGAELSFSVTNTSSYPGDFTYGGAAYVLLPGQTDEITIVDGSTTATIGWIDDLGELQERSFDFAPLINETCNGSLSVSVDADCAAADVTVTLTALGGEVTLVWSIDGAAATTEQLSGMTTLTLEAGGTLQLEANGEALADITADAAIDSACYSDLAIETGPPDCTSNTIEMTVSNTGTVAAAIEVTYANSTTTDTVAAGDSITLQNLQSGLPLRITNTDTGEVLVDRVALDVEFEPCEPDIDWDFDAVCSTGTLDIAATNHGDFAVLVAIVVDGLAPVTREIPAGAVGFPLDVAVGIDSSVAISAGDEQLVSYTHLEPCAFDLEVDIAVDCATAAATVAISNQQSRAVTLRAVNSNLLAEPLFDVDLGADSTVTYTWDLGDAASVDVIVDATGQLADQLVVSEAFFCITALADIWADASVDCASVSDGTIGAVRVVVGNSGAADGAVTITAAVSADAPIEATIPAGSAGEVFIFTVDVAQPVLVSVVDDAEQLVAVLTPAADCTEAEPKLSAWITCSASRVQGTWTNDGNAPGDVAITVDGSVIESWTLEPGATQPYDADRLDSPFLGDHVVSVIAAADGATLASTTISDAACGHDHASFDASIDADCDTGAIVHVSVTNTGNLADTVVLTINGVEQHLGPIEPGTTATFDVEQPVGSETHAALSHDGTNLAAVSWDTICEEPTPELAVDVQVDCGTESLVIAVRNTGEISDTVDVVVDGSVIATVTVAPGDTQRMSHGPIDLGRTYVVEVAGQAPVEAQDIDTAVCNEPTPELTATTDLDCDASTIDIVMRNTGGAAGTIAWTVDGAASSALLQPGETRTVSVAITLGAAVDIEVTADGETIHAHREADLCTTEGPDLYASTSIVCSALSLVVTISNSGRSTGAVSIDVSGEARTVAVAPLSTTEEVFDLVEDQLVDVTVTTDGGATRLLDEKQTANCAGPESAAEVALDCATYLVGYTLTNDSASPRAFVVTSAGNPDIAVEVAPGSTHKGFLAVNEGDTYDVSVTVDGQEVASASGPVNCVETQVLMAQGKLARTGVNTASLVVAATTLVVAGAFFTSAGRTREQDRPAAI